MGDKLQEDEVIPDSERDWLSLSGVAGMLGVHPSTVRLWSDKGVFPVHRPPAVTAALCAAKWTYG